MSESAMLKRLLVMCALMASFADSFNLDVKHAELFSDPNGKVESYFGYTVSLLKETGSKNRAWLLVGAPRGNSSFPNHTDIVEPGVAYQCELGDVKESCKQLLLDSSGNIVVRIPNSRSYHHKKDHAWIGGTMNVQGRENGSILICGSRWKSVFSETYGMNGICYLLRGPEDFNKNAIQLIPLKNIGKQVYKKYLTDEAVTKTYDRNISFYYAYGGAGFSADFVGNSSEIMIGAPGVLEWMGTVIKPIKRGFHSYDDSDFLVPDPLIGNEFNPDTYFGYAVGSGHFFNLNEIDYVAGAPRDGNLVGKVFIYEYVEDRIDAKVELAGTQVGEYFGSSLCVIDLNSDGLDDLIVGAPQYSLISSNNVQNTGDEGKIYVYINYGNGRLTEVESKKNIMGSEQQGARFGTAISNIGDLNSDGFPDVAVGAPYDTFGHGAVYIYQGSAEGINPKFVQRISAIKIDHSIKGFGISISKGIDVDDNHVLDLAVGAYGSGNVILFKSHPVISFYANLATNVRRINFTATEFAAKACIYYTGEQAPSPIDVAVTLIADEALQRAHFIFDSRNTSLYSINVSLQHEVEHCIEFKVNILVESHDFSKPIEIKMKYELTDTQDSPKNYFCKSCPVVDPSHRSFIIHKVPYVTGCGDDDRCRTDIKTEGSLLAINSPFVIGSKNKMELKVVIKNSGDPAFLSQTNVTFPNITPLIRVPKNCREILGGLDKTFLQCEMGNPLTSKEKRELLLEFDIRNVPSGTDELLFNVTSGSVGEELEWKDNIQEIALPLKTEVDLSITGISGPDQFYLVKQNDTYPEKVLSCSHVYEIQNHGPSPVNDAKLIFSIPRKLKTPSGPTHLVDILRPTGIIGSTHFLCRAIGFHFLDNSMERDNDTGIHTFAQREMGSSKQSITGQVMVPVSHSFSSSSFADSRTSYVNCSNTEAECVTIECFAGPFPSPHVRATVTIPLKITSKSLETVLDTKDIVVLTSYGRIEILNLPPSSQPESHRPDFAVVGTTIFGKLPESNISPWFIVLGVIAGLLILALIVWILIKVGFFKRDKKEELDSLKNKNELGESLTENMVS